MDPSPGDLADHPPPAVDPDVAAMVHPSRLLMAAGPLVLVEVDDALPEL